MKNYRPELHESKACISCKAYNLVFGTKKNRYGNTQVIVKGFTCKGSHDIHPCACEMMTCDEFEK